MIKFPSDFLWGSATSSYQVEGNNANADWWQWEHAAGKEPSALACNHYDLYAQDFDIIKSLNHNAHRLSIEWSRVEPKEGQFANDVIEHYIDVVKALRTRNIEPIVTLHHFTNPIWLSADGGWEDQRVIKRFARFCEVMVKALAPHVHFWITINEPTIFMSHAYLFGAWPPQGKSFWRMKVVHDNLVRAHLKVYPLINQIYQSLNCSKPAVSISHHVSAMVPCFPTLKNHVAVYLRDKYFNFEILDQLIKHDTLDFIGLNYYSRQLVDVKSWWIGNLMMETCNSNHDPVKKNSLGWDIYPEGLFQVLVKLKKYNLPIMITENGMCTLNDDERAAFIRDHLKSVHKAIEQGVNVTGYLYWSLMDNFEWDKGFGPRFGMIGIDYKTQQRVIRESAKMFAEICKIGILE